MSLTNQAGQKSTLRYTTPSAIASIFGNVISSNIYTAGRQPDISVTGQTTYSNVGSYTYTTFGTNIPLTPSTTGLTVSTYFMYTAPPYGGEGLWTCRLTSNTNVVIYARQTGGSDTIFAAYNSNISAQSSNTVNIPQVGGYTGNRATWVAGRKDHIVFTFTNTAPVVGRMYVNGVLNSTATSSNVYIPEDGLYTCLVPGNAYGSADANMSVYDFRIVNGILSASQVAMLYRTLSGNNVPVTDPPLKFTGAPLFSQLSSGATSSAVGAFSLRAVNGTSAKAIRVLRKSDNAQQDFYADRLGNLLAAPVTGQTLQNWLGGAGANVVTWYDQSGRGNHATQATAANQPTVTFAPSGSGYVPVFTSPAPNKYLSIPSSLNLGAINGSYTKSLWTYVTSNVNQFQNFLSTSVSGTTGIHNIGWNFQTGSGTPYFSAGQNNFTQNLVSSGTFPSNTWTHLAVTYNNPTQTFIMYRNGTALSTNTAWTSSFNAGDGLLPTDFRIGMGFGNACNSKNYDVTIFNTALSATDITTLYNSRIY